MKSKTKFLGKLTLIFLGLLFLVCVWLDKKDTEKKAPEGEKITVQDVHILLDALGAAVDIEDTDEAAPYLTYGQYMAVYGQLDGGTLGLPDFAGRYENEHELLKTDWYEAYRLMLAHLDTESSIWETTVFVLKVDSQAKEAYTESGAMQGAYRYCSTAFEDNVFQEMRVYVKNDSLLTIIEVLPEEHYLGNVWVMEYTDGVMECFYRQIKFRVMSGQTVQREQVADLTFADGKVVSVREKEKKIHGKLLRVSDTEMEIEGCGVYEIADQMEVYRLYGSLKTLKRADLKIGYEDTDFIIEKDKVCACLVSREEEADMIRVLLKNTVSGSNYHETAQLVVDGETIEIKADALEAGERRTYTSKNLTDKIVVNIKGIEKEDNAYRGTIECYKTPEGMVLVNELPLEEYLYSVVPSEMPASYPQESLKAQAVCARTYAYRFILHAGLPQLGAHVDDTTAYQVYHNCAENAATTTAVKDTAGITLDYEGEPAQNYYYSTSCGVGTDASIWKSEDGQSVPYIRGARLCKAAEEGNVSLEKLQEEEQFRKFITVSHEEDLESEEPWYRWEYTVDKLDTDTLLTRLQACYAASPESVLTMTKGGYFVSEPIERIGKVKQLSIEKRGTGGVAEELLIVTKEGTYKVISEYNIRSVLCDKETKVVRQDGSSVAVSSLLPSGFFVIDALKNGDYVVGYTLIGGGYGHGVGMSQNGAKALGKEGYTYSQILQTFFPECDLKGK